MATNAVELNINYSAYSGVQLAALLDEIQSQKAILDNRERQIREAINSLGAKSNSKKEKEAFYSPENVAVLKQGYKELKAGRGIERELIDA